ncbi:unnamed protein product [Hermetia illucens]|uniref:Uncharacterized protein n=1 Tax=Hermetia illucens TaxID=343691 RepID=A0A7R8YWU9_HERIL|nr:DNA translocase FtsK isoform X2 [Hermetia illucens]CAD7087181.1 unnamed protein product [Hermetia illucens]
MDYHQTNRFLGIAVFTAFIVLSRCEPADRDIILTPKESSQVKGKTLYYRPVEDLNNSPGVRVPWEQILKHLTYLTLYGIPYEKNQLSDTNADYSQFMNASYIIQTNNIVTNFGDIITLAEGHVEKSADSKYQFIEGKCLKEEQKCNEKTTIAQWLVQKIRHRDGEKKFRYEIKFSINPYNGRNEDVVEGREIPSGKRVTRAFILRDFDYPESFLWYDEHVSQRRLEENRRYLQRLHRFNEVFTQPIYIDSNYYTSDNPIVPQLNIGEFLQNPLQRKSPSYTRFIQPTTYRPNYHIKFSKPSLSYEIPLEKEIFPIKSPFMATHLHHHYYISDSKYDEPQKPYNQQNSGNYGGPTIEPAIEYEIPTRPPIKHQIPIPPNYAPVPPIIFSQYPTAASPTGPQNLPQNIAQNLVPQFSTVASPTTAQDIVRNLAQNVIQNLGFQLTQQIAPSIQPFVYNYRVTNNPGMQQQEYLQQATPTQPFVESPRYDNTRYSEPDPLYKMANAVEQQLQGPQEQQTKLEQSTQVVQEPTNLIQDQSSYEQQTSSEQQGSSERVNIRPEHDVSSERVDTRPQQHDISSESNEQLSDAPAFTYSSVIDTDPRVEKPNAVSPCTEQNHIEEIPPSTETVQLPPPQSESTQDTTIPYDETSKSQESIESPDISGSQEQKFDSSLEASKHQPAIGSVEVTHFSQPRDPPIVEQTLSSPPPPLTTERSVKSVQVIHATSPKDNLLDTSDALQITKAEAHFKSSSERPVLKWKPKRPRIKTPPSSSSRPIDDNDPTIIIAKTSRIRKPSLKVIPTNETSITFERIPDEDTIQKIYKIKSTTEEGAKNGTNEGGEVPTKQSFSTSISIKVGTSDELPLLPTISVPNVELYEAELERLNANSSAIKFFKASVKNENKTDEGEEDRVITRSILAHATSLGY